MCFSAQTIAFMLSTFFDDSSNASRWGCSPHEVAPNIGKSFGHCEVKPLLSLLAFSAPSVNSCGDGLCCGLTWKDEGKLLSAAPSGKSTLL